MINNIYNIYIYMIIINIYIYIFCGNSCTWAHDVHKSQKFKVRIDNWGFFSYNHTDQSRSVKAYIVQTTPSPTPFFKVAAEVSFDYLAPPEGMGVWKTKKTGWKHDAGAGLLKMGEGRLTLSLFNFFNVYHFYV